MNGTFRKMSIFPSPGKIYVLKPILLGSYERTLYLLININMRDTDHLVFLRLSLSD
jgi:hypothetical protein